MLHTESSVDFSIHISERDFFLTRNPVKTEKQREVLAI